MSRCWKTISIVLLVVLLLLGWLNLEGLPHSESAKIESQTEQIERELANLPDSIPVEKPWTLGYQSQAFEQPKQRISFEIDFNGEHNLDLITLFPAIRRADDGKFHPLGFPKRFYIEGLLAGRVINTLVDYRDKDYDIHGIEPQVFPITHHEKIDRVRLVATQLSSDQGWGEKKFRFALSEIMAFSGNENVALRKPFITDSKGRLGQRWPANGLVDGFFTFSPADRDETRSDKAFLVKATNVDVFFDLGSEHYVDGFRIWPNIYEFHHDYTNPSGHGFPSLISVERLESLEPASKREVLWKTKPERLLLPGSNPMERKVSPTTGRYFRMNLRKPVFFEPQKNDIILVSEIEILSRGLCVSQGVIPEVVIHEPTVQGASGNAQKTKRYLTDNIVDQGSIIPLRKWIHDINRRYTLERELVVLREDYVSQSQSENSIYRLLTLASLAIAVITGLVFWISRLKASQKLYQIREQIACDLHDQIGANLSSIAITNQLIQRTINEPTEVQSELIGRSISTARKTQHEATQIVRLLEGRISGELVTEQIHSIAIDLLGDIEITLDLKEKETLNELSTSKKWDLLLFVKEALNNVVKHAKASSVAIESSRFRFQTRLQISDDGCGISKKSLPLVHLQKRAERFGGTFQVISDGTHGTMLLLDF